MKPPLIIAHRGASCEAPENTLAAFQLAWRQGADAVEVDLRLTSDGEVVAVHDADGRRTLGDPRLIRETSLADFQSLDAGSWKHPRWKNERVPALATLLANLPPGKQLVLELKENLVPELVRALARAPRERITLIAFDAGILSDAKCRLPECRALWLFGAYASVPKKARGAFLAARTRELRVDGVDLLHDSRLTPGLLEPLRAEGRTVFAYTINRARAARRCAALGLDGITTDRPAEMRQWLGISA